MDLVISKKDLLRLLEPCVPITDKKAAMPALANVLLTAEAAVLGGTLHGAATDLYLSISCSVTAEISRAGAIALPAKDLLERVKAMPEGPVQIICNPNETNTTIKAVGASRRFTLHGLPAGEFPALPKVVPGAPELDLPVDLLTLLITRTHFSISTDETRPHVNSGLFEWSGDRVRMVSTDGHRLSKMEVVVAGKSATATMLIPLQAVHHLRSLCEGKWAPTPAKTTGTTDAAAVPPPTIKITQSGPNVFFGLGGAIFSVKLVDAVFPPYQQVIPSDSLHAFRMLRVKLMEAIRAVSLASSDRTGGVKFVFDADKVTIMAESPESGSAQDQLTIEPAAMHPITIGFNGKYFLDALGAMDSEEIALNVSGELDPAIARPLGQASDHDYIAVVMPMRV